MGLSFKGWLFLFLSCLHYIIIRLDSQAQNVITELFSIVLLILSGIVGRTGNERVGRGDGSLTYFQFIRTGGQAGDAGDNSHAFIILRFYLEQIFIGMKIMLDKYYFF